MAFQLFAESVSIHPHNQGSEVVLTSTDRNVDFSILTSGHVVFSSDTNRAFFADLNGRLWIVTADSFHIQQESFEELLSPADRQRPELDAEHRIFSPAMAAGLFN